MPIKLIKFSNLKNLQNDNNHLKVLLLIMKRRKFLFYSIISTLFFLIKPKFIENNNIIKKVKIGNKYWLLSSEDI